MNNLLLSPRGSLVLLWLDLMNLKGTALLSRNKNRLLSITLKTYQFIVQVKCGTVWKRSNRFDFLCSECENFKWNVTWEPVYQNKFNNPQLQNASSASACPSVTLFWSYVLKPVATFHLFDLSWGPLRWLWLAPETLPHVFILTPRINACWFLSLTGALYGDHVTFLMGGENVDWAEGRSSWSIVKLYRYVWYFWPLQPFCT